jgi:peptidoglycan/LPS O-acetylase OafA/YrhL
LRLILAILVLIGHSSVLSGHYFNFSFGIIPLTSLAVFGFFAVSGFLITPGIIRGGFVTYLLRRCVRIFPAFWTSSIVTVLIFGKIWQSLSSDTKNLSLPNIVSYLIHNIIFLPASPESPRASWNQLQGLPIGVPRSGVVNGSIWSLPLEFICYVALGILIVALKRYFSKRVEQYFVFILVAFWLTSVCLSFIVSRFWEPNPTLVTTILGKWPYILSFLIGSALSFHANYLLKFKYKFLIVPLMLVAFASSFNATTWALFGSGAFSVATICFGTSKIFENFSTKTDISYGIYLYHFPVVQTLVYFLDRRQDRFLLISMTLILSGVFAYMSAKIIEEPVLRWVRRIQANK